MPPNIRANFFHDSTALVGPGLQSADDSRWHSGTKQSVGLLWTSDQPIEETCAWKHITLTRDRHPCSRKNSNPKSQQSAPADPRLMLRVQWDRLTLVKNSYRLLIFLWPAICQYLVLNGITAVVRYLAVFASLSRCYPPKSDKTLKTCPSFKKNV
jgi:hypothetical protein